MSVRILVVDDDELVRRSTLARLVRGLAIPAADIIGTGEPKTVESLLEKHPGVKLILSDIEMPGLFGDTLHEEIASTLEARGIVFSPSTGGEPMKALAYFAACGIPVLRKPYVFEELAAVVAGALRPFDAPKP